MPWVLRCWSSSPLSRVHLDKRRCRQRLAQIDAITGKESSCLGRVELVRRTAAQSGTDVVVLQAEYVLGLLELGQGRFLAAVRQLERAHQEYERRGLLGPGHWPVLPDLVEATALSGDDGEARRLLALLRGADGA